MAGPDEPRKTLWEEGRHPGGLVVGLCGASALAAVGLSLLVSDGIGLFFDLVFVLACTAAALAVHPRDFFIVGVLPPLLLAVIVVVLASVDPSTVARPQDSLGQAIVSGLAHHAIALALGYGLTLGVLALRQVALHNGGTLRAPHPTR